MTYEIKNSEIEYYTCYLSDEVKHILSIGFNQTEIIHNDPNLWIDQSKCSLNFEYLSKKCIIYDHQNMIEYSQSNRNLKKYLNNIQKTMIKYFDPKIIESVLLNDFEIFKKSICSNLYFESNSNSSQSKLSVELAFTIYFPFFERFLGNLLYSLNGGNLSKIPFLLRDLVSHPSLEQVLGKDIINFIKLFFYTPKSLNLRNLCWHGFLNTDEYDTNHIYFLICIFCNIAFCLNQKEIMVKKRPKFNLESIKDLWLPKNLLLFSMFNSESSFEFVDFINNSKLIDQCRREKWKLIFSRKLDNFSLLNLILPELEHMLRKLYSIANSFSGSCSAEIAHTSEFYLTLDDLLNWKIGSSGKQNSLFDLINEKTCIILMDLFNYIDGPRLRDHLSHGELEPNIDDFYINVLSYLMIEIASDNKKINSKMDTYECNFHPIKITKIEVLRLFESAFYSKNDSLGVENVESLKFNVELNLVYRYDRINSNDSKSKELQLINLIRNLIKEIGRYLPKLKIKECLNESLKNNIHGLRERQRTSLQKFDIFIRNFKYFFNLNLKIISNLISKLLYVDITDNLIFYTSQKFLEFIKLLKINLKLFQNLYRFCECNKWIESNNLVILSDNNNVLEKFKLLVLS